jgi:hypothetical protein
MRGIIKKYCMANVPPYVHRLDAECRKDGWSVQRFPNRAEVEALMLRNEDALLMILRRGILEEKTELYDWQYACSRLLWYRKNKYSNYLLECTMGEGKSIMAYGAIVARMHILSYSVNKALLALPYWNLATEKFHELLKFYKYLADDNDPHADYIKPVQGSGANRQINKSCVMVCTDEHCLAILSSGMLMVNHRTEHRLRELITIVVVNEASRFDSSRGRVLDKLVGLTRLMNIRLLLIAGTMHINTGKY